MAQIPVDALVCAIDADGEPLTEVIEYHSGRDRLAVEYNGTQVGWRLTLPSDENCVDIPCEPAELLEFTEIPKLELKVERVDTLSP